MCKMQTASHISSTQRGFTLLEVIIAMTIAAMLLVGLSVAMNRVFSDWGRNDERLNDDIDKMLGILQLERALTGAYPHTYRDKKANKNIILFEGKKDELLWVSTVSPSRQAGLSIWQLTESKDKKGVNLRVVPAFVSDPKKRLKELEDEQKPLLLFENYRPKFEYLYVDETFNGKDNKWVKKWSAKKNNGLPDAVRIFLESVDERKAHSFEVIAVIAAHDHATIKRIKPK